MAQSDSGREPLLGPTAPVEADDVELAAAKAFRVELWGLLLYALSTVFGTGMSLFAKLAGKDGIGVFEVVLFRSLTLLAFSSPQLLWRKLNPFADSRYVLRGGLGFCSTSSLYWAVNLLPMADAAVLSFLSPIFVAALSPLVLKEHPSRAVFLAIPFCTAGVLLVARPSLLFGGQASRVSALGVAVGVVQAFFNATARMSVRALSLGGPERMAAIIFSMGLVSAIGSGAGCLALSQFTMPARASTWLALAGNGLLGYANQVTLTAGLQRAKAAPAVAMAYLSIVWGLLADVFVFSNYPSWLSTVGALVICCSSFFVAYGEKRTRDREKAAARWRQSQQRLARDSPDGLEEARRAM